jgi:transcriptional regulator with GAF, ATPase, and Fis domain
METPASDERARARRYLLQGDPALALGTCEAALAGADPERALALRVLAARAAGELGELPARIGHLEAAERLAREGGFDVLGEVLLQLGEAHLARNQPAHALHALEEAADLVGAEEPLRARLERLREEARSREAEAPEAEAEADASPETLRPAAVPVAAERLLAMVDRLLEGDPDLPLPAVLDLILAELVEATGADRGFVLLREPDDRLVIRAARDRQGGAVPEPEREVSRAIAERAADEAIALRAVRPAEDPRFADSRSAKALDLRAVVAASLRYRRVSLGSVLLDRRGRSDVGFDDAAEDLVARFAKLASSLIVRTRRRDQARRRTEALEAMFSRGTEQVGGRLDTLGFVGESEAAYRLLRFLERVAPSEARVLIRGESGTGKELVARILHANSSRAEAPFLAINCAALPEALLEAELFGHAKGAFTGADEDRPGLFERASGGTLFLDEIGDASPRLQAELLRVLQEGEVRRVGDDRQRPVDVRVIAATHQDLEAMCAEGRFREDLYYRLNTLQVTVPPLRERREDIPLLAQRFAKRARARVPDAQPLDDAALASLQTRDWPGNIRELENAVLSLVTLGELAHAAPTSPSGPQDLRVPLGARDTDPVLTLAEAERRAIVRALRQTGGAKKEAAKLLGIGRRTLYNKIRAYGLE